MPNEKKVVELNINDVLPNRFQPRIKFDENSINELALSIKKYGVIQPIVVRKIGDKYEIIAGERRYKASVLAGKQTIPAIISEMTDKDSVEIALIENVQREDLTPIEKAISYKKILDMGYISQEDLAQKVGKSQSSIANTLRLLNLSDEVQEALLENKISERHARSLLKLKDQKKQVEMLNRIITERLTVRKTDEEIDKMLNENTNSQPIENPIVKEEVVQIPDIELSSIDTTKLPGFMDIDKIEQTAQDITPQEKPVADMDELLKAPSSTTAVETNEQPLHEGKFFNFFEEPQVEQNNQSDFKLENFFSNMNTNNVTDSTSLSSSTEPSVPTIEPTIPEAPSMPSIEPSVPSIEPTIPEVPSMPSIEPSVPTVEPTIPEVPSMPSIEPSVPSIEPTIPEAPSMPSIEPSVPSIEPTMPEVPSMPSIEPSAPSIEPTIPEVLSMPNMEPSVPTIEPTIPEVPSTPSVSSIEPTMPEVPSTPSVSSIEPTVPGVSNIESNPSIINEPTDNQPIYEVPIDNNTTEIPSIDNSVIQSTNINNQEVENNIAAQNTGTTITAAAPNIRLALNTIRECENTLEKYGFTVDVEEIDFEDSYQVIFKIEKK